MEELAEDSEDFNGHAKLQRISCPAITISMQGNAM
jgi:hypothetical protein